MNKLARVDILVISLSFSFIIILLVSKPLFEKKDLLFSKHFCCRLGFLYLNYESIHILLLLVNLCKKLFFLVVFPVFTISRFQAGIFKSRSCLYGFPESLNHKLLTICSHFFSSYWSMCKCWWKHFQVTGSLAFLLNLV